MSRKTIASDRTAAAYPTAPGYFWRRIVTVPGPSCIAIALEDDVHHFQLRLDIADGRIHSAVGDVLRMPWTGCAGAATFIADELVGQCLDTILERDASLHCTHLFDMAVIAAWFWRDTMPRQFDLKVTDRVGDQAEATLLENGKPVVVWQLMGTEITGPSEYAGRDLRALSQWQQDLMPDIAQRMMMLRRAVYVSGVRQFQPPTAGVAIDMGPHRQAVCYNYQPERARTSLPVFDCRDFAAGGAEPLSTFDVQALLARGV